MYFSGDDYKEIFRVPNESLIYGYGLLSNDIVLFAYQDPKQAAAIAIMNVINAKTGKIIFTKELGGAGETSFDFSIITGKGVFNNSEGLNVIHLADGNVSISRVSGVEIKFTYAPFWIDSKTIGYFVHEDEKQVFKTIEVR